MSERLENGHLLSDKLALVRNITGVLADDLSSGIVDERRVNGVLTALLYAIENDQLDSLFRTVLPWMAAEIARVDALAAGERDGAA